MFNEKMINDYADKLLIGLSDEEVKDLLDEFDAIKEKMDIIANIENIKDVEPLSYPQEIYTNSYRKDEDIRTITTEDALKNAGEKIEDVVVVPKVVGE